MRRLTLVACLVLGLMAGSTGSASAMIRAKYLAKPSPGATTPQAPAPAPGEQRGPGGTTSPPAPAPPDPAPGGDPTAPLPPSNPHALQVVSGEYFLQLSKSTVSAGDVRVEFNNAFAEDPHDLHLVREDGTGSSYAFGELQSGEVEAKTLDLDAGRWTLFCALPEHATRGMRATLRVAGG
jgi:plastocyanin